MEKVYEYIRDINITFGALVSLVCAYFESTTSFMIALLLGFIFNILAGLRADEVKFEMWRLCNFSGHKFKDSLIELFLIVAITYFLKLTADLMDMGDRSVYIVECLVWVALYNYIRNGLRNLAKAYPENRWINFVGNLVSFKFNEFAPESIKRAWDKSEKPNEKENETK